MPKINIPTSEEYSQIQSQKPEIQRRLNRIHRTERVSVGEVRGDYETSTKIGPRLQDRYEMVIVRSGLLHLTLDSGSSPLRSGQVALLKPGHREVLEIDRCTDYHQIWCIVRKERVPAVLASRLASFPNGFSQEEPREFQTLIDLALDAQSCNRTIDAAFYESLVISTFYEFVRSAEFPSKDEPVYPDSLLRALEFIELNLHRQIDLDEIAESSGIAKHYMVKLFSAHLGETPIRFLWNLRIQKGAELLRSSGLNVSEVADATGFQSPFHFSRLFKKHYKSSPSQFRETMWRQSKIPMGKKNNAKRIYGTRHTN